MDYLSSYFLSIIGHGLALSMVFWNMDDYIKASLPLDDYTTDDYLGQQTQLTVCLAISLALTVAELILLFVQIPSLRTATMSILWHFIAALMLLKLCIDSHPIQHFWIIFVVFSVPTLLLQLITFFSWINYNLFC